MSSRSALCLPILVVACSLLAESCGFGTAAVGSALGNDPASAQDVPILVSLDQNAVSNTHLSPARITVTVQDPAAAPSAPGRPAVLSLSFGFDGDASPGFADVPIGEAHLFLDPQLTQGASLGALATSQLGTTHVFYWDFAAQFAQDPALAGAVDPTSTYVDGYTLRAAVPGGSTAGDAFSLGNDPPVVSSVVVSGASPQDPITGFVAVSFALADSAGDVTEVVVEYAALDGGAAPVWQAATPEGTDLSALSTLPDGAPQPQFFLWDALEDLGSVRRTVSLRFTPRDGTVEDGVTVPPGVAVVTPQFLIDNNNDPLVLVDQTAFQLLQDERRGIPIPFQISDVEGDPVRVVFQWRLASEPLFNSLGQFTVEEILANLDDPEFRIAYRIATDYRASLEGRPAPAGSSEPARVRLPELSDTDEVVRARGVLGMDLDILRATGITSELAEDWGAGAVTLEHPIAAAPVGDGREALVLDIPGNARWRLRRVELATGSAVAVESGGQGRAIAMAPEDPSDFALVALDDGDWRIVRVELETGATTELATGAGTAQVGELRALVSLGTQSFAATIDDRLVLFEAPVGGAVTAHTLASGLSAPDALARDPRPGRALLVAERGSAAGAPDGRLVSIDLLGGGATTLRVTELAGGPAEDLPRPSSVAAIPGTRQILVVTDENAGVPGRELRRIDLDLLGVVVIDRDLSAEDVAVGAGPDGLQLLALPRGNRLLARGGLEQRRRIDSFAASANEARVDAPFAPPLDEAHCASRTWRLAGLSPAIETSPTPRRQVFVWDSSDVPGGGDVVVQAIPLDAEMGVASAGGGSASLVDAALGEPAWIDAPGCAGLDVGDVGGDGRLELVAVERTPAPTTGGIGGRVRALSRGADGAWTTLFTLGDEFTLRAPNDVRVVDLDGDARPEIVVANGNPPDGLVAGNFLAVYHPLPGGGFVGHAPAPDVRLGSTATTLDPAEIEVADVDGDGRLDLVCANRSGGNVAVFLQQSGGGFGTGTPIPPSFVLGGPSTTPFAVGLAAADLEGDGDVDIAVVSATTNRVAVFRAATGGVFGAAEFSTGFATPLDVAIGDVDGDGRLDLAVAHQSSASSPRPVLALLSPEVDGMFGSAFEATPIGPASPTPGDVALSVRFADLDSDGDQDLVLRRELGLDVVVNKPHVVFQAGGDWALQTLRAASLAGPDYDASSTFLAGMRPAVGDVDGDGDLDIATGRAAGAVIVPHSSSGESLRDDGAGMGSRSDVAPHLLACGDLDGDSDLDLVAPRPEGGLRVFLQAFPGAFSSGASVDSFLGGQPIALQVADLGFTGSVDCVVLQRFGSALHLDIFSQVSPGILTDGAGDDVFIRPIVVPGPSSGRFALRVADLVDPPPPLYWPDSLELVVGCGTAATVHVFRQLFPSGDGTARFELSPGLTLGPSADAFGDLRDLVLVDVVDLAGPEDDRLLDLVVARGDGAVVILAQTAPGEFGGPGSTAEAPIPTLVLADAGVGGPAEGLAIGDLDGNGFLDIVVARPSAGLACAWLQRADLQFGDRAVPGTSDLRLGAGGVLAGVASVALEDLDRDGDLDVVAGHGEHAGFVAFEQRLPGWFVLGHGPSAALVGTGGTSTSLVLADVDEDGDRDVAIGALAGSPVRIWLGGR